MMVTNKEIASKVVALRQDILDWKMHPGEWARVETELAQVKIDVYLRVLRQRLLADTEDI